MKVDVERENQAEINCIHQIRDKSYLLFRKRKEKRRKFQQKKNVIFGGEKVGRWMNLFRPKTSEKVVYVDIRMPYASFNKHTNLPENIPNEYFTEIKMIADIVVHHTL